MQFKYSINNFRGLAILFVMLSHMGSLHWLGSVGDLGSFLVGDATTWFVFISGYLFYHIEFRRFRYKDYLGKKAKFVLLPYLVFFIPAILAGLYFSRDVLFDLSRGAYVLWSLLVGGSVAAPMWFIPMIVIFFFLSPVFHALARTRWIYVATFLGLLISLFTFRPIHNLNPFLAFLHFFGFYLLGMLMSINSGRTDGMKQTNAIYPLIGAGLLVFIITIAVFDFQSEGPLGFWDGLGQLNIVQLGKFGLLVAVFFTFERFLDFKQPLLDYLAEISFGLFFVHGFFVLLNARLQPSLPSPCAAFLFEFIFVVFGSVLTVYLVKLIFKKKSRYVVGC